MCGRSRGGSREQGGREAWGDGREGQARCGGLGPSGTVIVRADVWGDLCYQTNPSGVMACSFPKDLSPSHSDSPPGTFVPEPGDRQSQLGDAKVGWF